MVCVAASTVVANFAYEATSFFEADGILALVVFLGTLSFQGRFLFVRKAKSILSLSFDSGRSLRGSFSL